MILMMIIINIIIFIPGFLKTGLEKNINSFYFLTISNEKTHSKANWKPLSDAGQ